LQHATGKTVCAIPHQQLPCLQTAEIYSPLGGTTTGGRDIIKRGGRYTSDFIWNVNWQEQLEYEANVQELVDRGRQQRLKKADTPEAGTVSFSRKALLARYDSGCAATTCLRQLSWDNCM
jgi:hypothetical protein